MPAPQSLEQAVQEMMAHNNLSRGEAISAIRGYYDQGDKTVRAIPNISESLEWEGFKGEANAFADNLFNTAAKPVNFAARLGVGAGVPGAKYIEDASQISPQEMSQHEPAPTAGMLGDFAGVPVAAAEMGGVAKPILAGAGAMGVPFATALSGPGTGAGMARGALMGAGLAQTGALGPGAQSPGGTAFNAALGGAAPMVEEGLGWAGGKLGRLASRLMPDRSIQEPIAARAPQEGGMATETPAQAPPAQPGPFTPSQPPEAMLNPFGPVPPEQPPVREPTKYPGVKNAATSPSAVGPFSPIPPAGAPTPEPMTGPRGVIPTGLANARQGQPFEVTSHMAQTPSSRPGMFRYVDSRSSLAQNGKIVPATFQKPYILDVAFGGEQGWRDAARSLFSNNPAILKAIDGAKDPVGLAEELMGRWATKYSSELGGPFDSIVISTPEQQDDILLDLRNFKSSPHPELTKEVTGFQPTKKAQVPSESQPKGRVIKLQPESSPELQKAGEDLIKEFHPETSSPYHASGEVPEGWNEGQDHLESVAQAVAGSVEKIDQDSREALQALQDKSINAFARLVPPAAARDTEDHAAYFQDIYKNFTHYDKQEWNRLGRIYKRVRNTFQDEHFDAIAAAMHDMDYDDEGHLEVLPGTPKHIADPAKGLFRVKDRIYSLITGNAPQVPSVMERWALPHSEIQLKRLKLIQEGFDKMLLPRGATQQEYAAAEQLAGKLTGLRVVMDPLGRPSVTADWHDMNIDHIQGFLNISPVENEEALLKDAIRTYEAQKAAGLAGPDAATEAAEYQAQLARLQHLKTSLQRDAIRGLPSRDYIPKKAFYGPIALSEHPEARPYFYDKDPDVVFERWIRGGLRKAKSDYVLWRTRQMLGQDLDASTKEWYTSFANIVRGATAYRGDANFARWWNRSLLGKIGATDAGQVHKITDFILGWQTRTKLMMSPFRFPFINLTHPFMTLYPVVGEKYFAKGLARVLANPTKAFSEAIAAGDIGHESQWFEEISQMPAKLGAVSRALRTPTYWTENFRIVLAREAGLAQAADGQYSKLVRGFVEDGPWENLVQKNRAYTRALVGTTQFRFGPEGKPLAFTGSPVRRMVSQFKSWPAGMTSLYIDMIKQRDTKALLRGLGAMFFFGGLPALMGGEAAFNLVRHELLKKGYNLPEMTGMQAGIDLMGLKGTGIDNLDLMSLREPFGLVPFSLPGVFGPALGSTIDLAQTTWSGAQEDNYRKVVSQLSQYALGPQVNAAMQAGREIYNQGQIFGPSGELEATRPLLSAIVRGIDMAPSGRSQVWKYTQDMADALESGNAALVQRIAEEAQSKGVVLGPQFEARVRGVLARRKKGAQIW